VFGVIKYIALSHSCAKWHWNCSRDFVSQHSWLFLIVKKTAVCGLLI